MSIGHVRNPDPQFPNRPQHPDFHLLSEVVRDNDENHTDRIEDRIAEYIDPESLRYMVTNRASMAVQRTGAAVDVRAVALLGGAMLDAFLLGAEYTRRQSVAAFDDSLNAFLTDGGYVNANDAETIDRFRKLIERHDAWRKANGQ